MINKNYDVLIVGGGAAGFFSAINTAQKNPELIIGILERGSNVLSKVRISGGGRCNLTHAEFKPKPLSSNYPRGQKELLGPFHAFMTGDTIKWFEDRGVRLKIEEDGRVFPESNSAQTIIDCFTSEADKCNIDILLNHSVQDIRVSNKRWELATTKGTFSAEKILIATGSSPKIWTLLEELGHQVVTAVPSLFTFSISDPRLKSIPGVVAKHVELAVNDSTLTSSGPLLITHSGISAPSVLKLSAYAAIELAKRNYNFDLTINFIAQDFTTCFRKLGHNKIESPKKLVRKSALFGLPKRLWEQLVIGADFPTDITWAEANQKQLQKLAIQLTSAVFKVTGKSTFKEEFVTAGGVALKEINFKTFESKIHKNLFFAGEVLNIDAVTGGFNFQNAWTGAFIAAQKMGAHPNVI
jgi:predicted Rossmann fold flavoprotein